MCCCYPTRSAAGAKTSAMEAERARRPRRLDAQHDSAARLRRETPWLEFIDHQDGRMRIIVTV
jgi:hypothetical protein